MWLFKRHKLFLYLLFVGFISMTASAKNEHINHVNPTEQSSDLQQFAWKEFQARSNAKKITADNSSLKLDHITISFSIDKNLTETYCLTVSQENISAQAKTLEDGKWLVFQILELLSQTTSNIQADDLPPASINLNTHCHTFDFAYREPFFPTNLKAGNTFVFGTHSVDLHWGLWGHNISKITTPVDEIFSSINNEINKKQFCFTSEALFDQFSAYILNNFGENPNETIRFMIMPEDNDIVCLCDNCSRIGNTTGNASPATAYLL